MELWKKNAEFRKKTQEKERKSYEKIAKSRVTNRSGCRRGVSTTIYISFLTFRGSIPRVTNRSGCRWGVSTTIYISFRCISNFAGCLKNEKVLVEPTISYRRYIILSSSIKYRFSSYKHRQSTRNAAIWTFPAFFRWLVQFCDRDGHVGGQGMGPSKDIKNLGWFEPCWLMHENALL